MSRPIALVAAALLSGCIVYDDDVHDTPPVNYAPYVTYADGGCYWDDYYHDYVWWFEAGVDDVEGDVTAVWAMVYYQDGVAADTEFELFFEGGGIWFSAWQESSTYLDCAYPGYVVEIYAQDYYGDADAVSFYPEQLW